MLGVVVLIDISTIYTYKIELMLCVLQKLYSVVAVRLRTIVLLCVSVSASCFRKLVLPDEDMRTLSHWRREKIGMLLLIAPFSLVLYRSITTYSNSDI